MQQADNSTMENLNVLLPRAECVKYSTVTDAIWQFPLWFYKSADIKLKYIFIGSWLHAFYNVQNKLAIDFNYN